MFSSITIGDGGDFATISLWQQSRRNNVVNNVVNDELTLLSGTYDAGVLLWYWPTDTEELSINVIMQAHPSALHNGDWDSGVCLSGGAQGWKVKYNDLNVTYRDIVFKEAQVNFEQGDNYFGSRRGTDWDMSAIHHGRLTFDRCMIYTEGVPHTGIYYESYTPSSSPSAFGTFEANYNNCVLEDTIGPVYPGNATIVPAYTNSLGDHTYNFRGCTLSRQGFLNSQRITNNAPSASLTVNLSGCIEDTSSAAQPTLIPGHPINLGYHPGGAGFPSGLSATIVDHITNEASGSVYDWAQTKTNVSYEVPFNYDGTVTSGQVNFVDNGDVTPSAFRDYRLVADANNLAVKYVDNTILPTRDVANGVRPHFADAGAYQSSSTNVNDYYIGTDYATFLLWHADRKNSILNGETERLIYPSGIYVDPGHTTWIKDFDRVNFDLVLKADTSAYHNGDWDSGAIFSSVTTNNKFDFAFYEGHSVNVTFDGLVRFRKEQVGGRINIYPAGEFSFFAPTRQSADYDRSLTLKNCLTHHTGYIIAADGLNNFAYDIDASGNITRRGKNTLTLENCVYDVAPLGFIDRSWKTLGSVSYGGSGHSVYNFKGCTFNNVGIEHSTYANEVVDINIEGVISRSGSNLGADLFFFAPPSQATINSNGYYTDSYVTHLSGTNFYNNLDILYDGQAPESSGAISFLGASAWETSTPGNYRLTPHANNLPVEYLTQYVDDLKIPTLDVANYPRPSKTDAGAYQSITNVVSSFEIGSNAAGHSRDGDYATVALWYSSERLGISNGDTLELILLEGDHTIGGITYSNFNQVNFDLVFKGETHHNGYWTSGTDLTVTSYGNRFFFNTAGQQDNVSRGIKFKDLVIKHQAILADIRTAADENHSVDFELTRCMVSGGGIYKYKHDPIDNRTTHNILIVNCPFDSTSFGSPVGTYEGSASFTIKGCSIKTSIASDWANPKRGSVLVEGCIFDNPNPNKRFISAPGGSGIFIDCITSESAAKHAEAVGTGSSVNVTTDASFNYSGTFDNFVPGEATFVEGSSVFVPYADTRNPIVNNATNSAMPTTDITGAERDSLPDIGAYEAVFIPVSSTLLVTPINLYN